MRPVSALRPVSILALLVCIGANGTTARAQPGDVPEPPQKNAFRPGLWSLQFAIANNFTLSSFQGSSLSCKRHFSERVALRAGVSLTGSYVDQGATERNEQNIGLNAQYLIYPNPTGKVRLYYGAGPELALSRSKAEQSSGTSGSSTTTTRWSLGAGCVLGGEWFVVDGVSLLAEYGSAFTFDDTRVKYVSGSSTSESKTRSIALSAKSVRFGLSLYF